MKDHKDDPNWGPGNPAYDKSVQPNLIERIFGFIAILFMRRR